MTAPGRSSTWHRVLVWVWIANLPVCVLLYLWAPDRVTLLYLALVSVYANIASHAAAEHASRAEEGQ